MNDKTILRKAIEKAEKNGYKEHLNYCSLFIKRNPKTKKKFTKRQLRDLMARVWLLHINDIIFSHSFAKAFWGEDVVCPRCLIRKLWHSSFTSLDHCTKCGEEEPKFQPAWKFHIEVMVLREKRLKYIEGYL